MESINSEEYPPTCKIKGCVRTTRRRPDVRAVRFRHECDVCRATLQKYGISGPERDKILAKQENRCKLCESLVAFQKQSKEMVGKSAVVDHCHSSGRVRGILCYTCNLMLGHAKDDTNLLRKAIGYLNDII